MTKNKKITLIVSGFIFIAAVGVLFALNSNQVLRAAGIIKSPPSFTFDESKASEWWAAKNYNAQASASDDYEGAEPIDKLPLASINVFKGTEGSYETACFVMFSYYGYQGDIAQFQKEKEDGYKKADSAKRVGETEATLKAFGKDREVTLSQYELIGPDAENSMKGMSYGWIDLDDKGYIAVSGVCPTASELSETIPAVSAVSLMQD